MGQAAGTEARPEWPARGAICLDCRTALPAGVACPANPRHGVVELAKKSGREALLTTVWGPPSVRARAKRAAGAGGSGAAGGAFAEGCGSCSGCDAGAADPQALIIVAALALIFALVYFLGSFLVRKWREHRAKLIPNGAAAAGLSSGLSSGKNSGRPGTVVATATAKAPLTRESCVAFAYELRHKKMWRRGRTTLRDAASIGFDVQLDSGERVRIPAGAIALGTRSAETARVDPVAALSYLASIDPQRDHDPPGEHDTIPYSEIRQVLLKDGARVLVRGRLEPRLDVAGVSGGYRDQAPTVLVPVDVPPRIAPALAPRP